MSWRIVVREEKVNEYYGIRTQVYVKEIYIYACIYGYIYLCLCVYILFLLRVNRSVYARCIASNVFAIQLQENIIYNVEFLQYVTRIYNSTRLYFIYLLEIFAIATRIK